jgi:hypothetical protein
MSGNKELAEVLVDFATALESACVNLKRYVLELVNVEDKPLWDPDKIKWEKAQSDKGEYERSEDVDNPEFKALLKDLAGHGGKMNRLGYFYWSFQNGATVGRKKRRA